MKTDFARVQASDPLWIAHEKLRRFNLSAIPVVVNDDLKGLVTLADIRRILRENAPSTQRSH
jgi:CBS domain-containing protein